MSQAKAIKIGASIPTDYKEMTKAECRTCKAQYLIIHELPFADSALAEKQAIFMRGYLTGEHVDPKHTHLDVYEPLD